MSECFKWETNPNNPGHPKVTALDEAQAKRLAGSQVGREVSNPTGARLTAQQLRAECQRELSHDRTTIVWIVSDDGRTAEWWIV
jgi:hypothetical protein